MIEKKTYYWLKLQKNFFNSLEIKTILKHEKGSEYVIFWQKLLLEVIDKIDYGFIRYKESIPYTPQVLSTITDTDIDTVKGAMDIFIQMKMVEITQNGDLIIDEVIHELIGRITNESLRKKNYREKVKQLKQVGQCPTVVPKCPHNIEIEIEIDKEIDIEPPKQQQRQHFTVPTEQQVSEYLQERKTTTIDPAYFIDYYTSKDWMIGKNKMKDWKAAIRNWERRGVNFEAKSKPKYRESETVYIGRSE